MQAYESNVQKYVDLTPQDIGVELYLYSPAQLDSYAKAEAEKLHINFVQLDFPKWRWKRRYHNQTSG